MCGSATFESKVIAMVMTLDHCYVNMGAVSGKLSRFKLNKVIHYPSNRN